MNALGTDVLSQINIEEVLAPVAITTESTKTSEVFATDKYRSGAVAIIGAEAVGDGETFSLEDIIVETSDTEAGTNGWTTYNRTRNAADVVFDGVEDGSTITKLFGINFDGSEGFMRIKLTGTSSDGTTTVYAVLVKGGADVLPQN